MLFSGTAGSRGSLQLLGPSLWYCPHSIEQLQAFMPGMEVGGRKEYLFVSGCRLRTVSDLPSLVTCPAQNPSSGQGNRRVGSAQSEPCGQSVSGGGRIFAKAAGALYQGPLRRHTEQSLQWEKTDNRLIKAWKMWMGAQVPGSNVCAGPHREMGPCPG